MHTYTLTLHAYLHYMRAHTHTHRDLHINAVFKADMSNLWVEGIRVSLQSRTEKEKRLLGKFISFEVEIKSASYVCFLPNLPFITEIRQHHLTSWGKRILTVVSMLQNLSMNINPFFLEYCFGILLYSLAITLHYITKRLCTFAQYTHFSGPIQKQTIISTHTLLHALIPNSVVLEIYFHFSQNLIMISNY